MTLVRALVSTSVLAATAASPAIARQPAAPGTERVLRVTSPADDGAEGTLRWAIEAGNATPERETIAIGPGVIVLKSALPPIKGPVVLQGAAWPRTGDFAVIDGSGYIPSGGPENCPGETPGQYGANVRTMTSPGLQLLDTADVEISGVEIRRFCIGILINRASRIVIRDSRLVENRGGAGVMLTGDDGQGNPTSTTTIHNQVLRNEFVDNGDGLELTRGAAFNLIADNVFRSTAANPEPSQGIEILRGHDNVVSRNHFEGYSDGLQVNWGDRNYIVSNTFTGNTFGLNLTGAGNIADSNVLTANRIGIVVRPAELESYARLTRNRISGNGREIRRCDAGGSCSPSTPGGAIVLGLPGLEHASFVGSRGRGVTPNPATLQYICPEHAPHCQSPPNRGLAAPKLTGARIATMDVEVSGSVSGAAATRYTIELFGNTGAGDGEGEIFIDEQAVYTNAAGAGAFTIRVERSVADRVRSYTATLTSPDGATSALSNPLPAPGAPSR